MIARRPAEFAAVNAWTGDFPQAPTDWCTAPVISCWLVPFSSEAIWGAGDRAAARAGARGAAAAPRRGARSLAGSRRRRAAAGPGHDGHPCAAGARGGGGGDGGGGGGGGGGGSGGGGVFRSDRSIERPRREPWELLDCPGSYQSWVRPTGAGMYLRPAGPKAPPERARSPQGARAASAAAARAAQGRLAAEHQHVQEVNSFVAAPF
jgi:hypothetical protein